MKRTAFTMIELIFVIVILGILASVALPKLAGVQDDALEASERAGVASARTGVQALHGKRIIRGQAPVIVSLADNTGVTHSVTFTGASSTTPTDPHAFSNQGYPWGLSIAAAPGTDTSATPNVQAVQAADGTQMPLVVVLELENPGQWATSIDAGDGNRTSIKGPASSTISTGSDAIINTASDWLYVPTTGQIILDVNGSL